MRTLYERIGGAASITIVVDELYDRLTCDPRVSHHFDPARLTAQKAGQCAWLATAFGSPHSEPATDLRQAHRHLEISDEQVTAVLGHLEAALGVAEVDDELRRQAMSLITRLWYARVF